MPCELGHNYNAGGRGEEDKEKTKSPWVGALTMDLTWAPLQCWRKMTRRGRIYGCSHIGSEETPSPQLIDGQWLDGHSYD